MKKVYDDLIKDCDSIVVNDIIAKHKYPNNTTVDEVPPTQKVKRTRKTKVDNNAGKE